MKLMVIWWCRGRSMGCGEATSSGMLDVQLGVITVFRKSRRRMPGEEYTGPNLFQGGGRDSGGGHHSLQSH